MVPIESAGASALARGSPSAPQNSFAARSGADKAQSLQSSSTANAAAPVETARAIAQTQAAQKSRLNSQPQPASQPLSAQASTRARSPATLSLAKPMTAVLLHELRLQQELADVQEEKGKKDS